MFQPNWWISPRIESMYHHELSTLTDMCHDLGEDHPEYITANEDFIRRGGHNLYSALPVQGPYTSEYEYPSPS